MGTGSADVHPKTLMFFVPVVVVLTWLALSGLADLPIDTDDAGYLENSSRMVGEFSRILSPDLELAGRPVTQLFFYLGFRLWGEDITPFHLLTIALHLFASALLAVAAWRSGLQLRVALVAGIFFLLHAGHFRAVHWVSALAYPLALIGSLTTLLCYREYLRGTTWWLAASYGAAFVGTLSHVAAVAVLPACYLLARQQRQLARQSVRTLVPLAVVLAASVCWLLLFYRNAPQVVQAVDGLNAAQVTSYFLLLVGRLVSTAHWFWVPTHLFYGWEPYFGLLVLGLLLGIAWRFPEIRLWATWPIAAALLFSTSSTEVASRYLYLPSAGTSVVLARCLQVATMRAAKRVGRRASEALQTCAILVILMASTVALRNALAYSHYLAARHHMVIHKTESSLEQLNTALGSGSDLVPREPAFVYLVSLSMTTGSGYLEHLRRGLVEFPQSAGLQALQGVIESLAPAPALREIGRRRVETAAIELESSGEDAKERLAGFYHNMGKGYYQKGSYDRALEAFRISLRYQPEKRITVMGIIGSTYALGDFEKAAAVATASSHRWPQDREMLYWAARSLMNTGKTGDAASMAKRAIAIGPTPDLLLLQADLLLQAGDHQAAAASFSTAIDLAPSNHRAYAGLAELLFGAGEYEKVTHLLGAAVAAGAANGQIYFTLGNANYAAGRLDAAREAYTNARALDPDNLRIHSNLGVALQKVGRVDEAAEVWRQVVQRDARFLDQGQVADLCRIAVQLAALYRSQGEAQGLHRLLKRLAEVRSGGTAVDIVSTTIEEIESHSETP